MSQFCFSMFRSSQFCLSQSILLVLLSLVTVLLILVLLISVLFVSILLGWVSLVSLSLLFSVYFQSRRKFFFPKMPNQKEYTGVLWVSVCSITNDAFSHMCSACLTFSNDKLMSSISKLYFPCLFFRSQCLKYVLHDPHLKSMFLTSQCLKHVLLVSVRFKRLNDYFSQKRWDTNNSFAGNLSYTLQKSASSLRVRFLRLDAWNIFRASQWLLFSETMRHK